MNRVTLSWIQNYISNINGKNHGMIGSLMLVGFAPGFFNVAKRTENGCHDSLENGMSLKEVKRFLRGYEVGLRCNTH